MSINRVQIVLFVLYKFPHNKSFDQLSDISPENFIFLRTFNQNSKPLEIED